MVLQGLFFAGRVLLGAPCVRLPEVRYGLPVRLPCKVGKDGRSIEVRHAPQIVLIQIVRRVYAAADQQFVLGAGANQIAECDLDVEIVQLLQKTVRFS